MRRMGTRTWGRHMGNKITRAHETSVWNEGDKIIIFSFHVFLDLLVPMRRMGTHPGCAASHFWNSPWLAYPGLRRRPERVPMQRMGTRVNNGLYRIRKNKNSKVTVHRALTAPGNRSSDIYS